MKTICKIITTATISFAQSLRGLATLPAYSLSNFNPSYKSVWSDEFNGVSLDTNSWNYDMGNNGGWGNYELQYYTNAKTNVNVAGGSLNIIARKEQTGQYTSGRIQTKGKRIFKHGLFEIRAKLPRGQGIWPGIWMLGNNIDQVSWPNCGEIDIAEMVGGTAAGKSNSRVYGTLHWPNNQYGNNYDIAPAALADDFHVYWTEWTPSFIAIGIDGKEYFRMPITSAYPQFYSATAADYFLVLNVAVGGNWPGSPDSTTVFPQTMSIDYIRVYQIPSNVPITTTSVPTSLTTTNVPTKTTSVPITSLTTTASSSCCAAASEDVYSPNVCPASIKPVNCCSGLTRQLVGGKWICKAPTTSTCCAKVNEDIYSPYICPASIKPVNCCSGLIGQLEGGKWICK